MKKTYIKQGIGQLLGKSFVRCANRQPVSYSQRPDNRKIYLFEIPKNTFKAEDLVKRSYVYKIDLQIMYDDDSFTDKEISV